MKKAETLTHWRQLPPGQPLKPSVVPYKHRGSTYAEDGIRITGSREWIDSVLSRLKDMLAFETTGTRLQLTCQESKDRETGRPLGSWNCYVQVHQRGSEAEAVNTYVSAIAGREVLVSAGY